jgi:glycosyltransferase involved in cell wall biosynthesis
MAQLKIALLIDWFVPGYKAGGPIQSVFNFCFAFKKDYRLFVITSDTDLNENSPYHDIISDRWVQPQDQFINVYYLSKRKRTYFNIQSLLCEVAPDFIYLNHIFSVQFVIFPWLIWWLKRIDSKLVICPRGALFDSAMHHGNSYLKKIIFIHSIRMLKMHHNVLFHSTNDKEKITILKYFKTDKIVVANNLANRKQVEIEFIKKEQGALKMVYVARILPIKNLFFLLKLLNKIKSKLTLTIAGPIEDSNYWDECLYEIKRLPQNITVECKGAVPHQLVSTILKENHLFVLPTEGENFGHSIFESLLAGRPVLISDQTPWKNLESLKIGWDIALTDSNRFIEAIEFVGQMDQVTFNNWAESAWYFAQEFNHRQSDLKNYKNIFCAK